MLSPEPKRVWRCASTCLLVSRSTCLVPVWQILFPVLGGLCLKGMHRLPLSKGYKTNNSHQLLLSLQISGGRRYNIKGKNKGRIKKKNRISPTVWKLHIITFSSICSSFYMTLFPPACHPHIPLPPSSQVHLG